MVYLVPILCSLGFFALVACLAWMVLNKRKRELEVMERLNTRLVDKFDTPSDMIEFLKTDEGRNFITNLTTPRRNQRSRVLSWMSVGIVVLFFGLAFLILGAIVQHDEDFITAGLVFAFPGMGFIVAAWLSAYLSRKWDLIQGKPLDLRTSMPVEESANES